MQQFLIALLASLGVAVALVVIVRLLQRRLRIVALLAFPLYVGAVALALRVFTAFEVEQTRQLDAVLSWLLIFLAAIVVLRVVGIYLFDVYLEVGRGIRLPPLLPRVVTWLGYLVAGLVSLKFFFPDQEFGAILTASAITSLVLGLALQPILGNFFAGLVISVERPFRINDWIRFGSVEARVVDITWRTTHLRTRENDTLVVPNGKIADDQIVNFYYPHKLHMLRLYVGVHYRTPPYRVKQALLDAAARVEGVLERPSPEVFVVDFGDSAIQYELRLWIQDFAHRPRIESHARSEIWEQFERLDITIPFPIRTLEIEPAAGRLEITRPAARASAEPRAHPARLFVARGNDRGRALTLGAERVTVGRSAESDLVLQEPKMSKDHLSIEWSDGQYRLRDDGSRYGTRVNGRRVEQSVLKNLDRIEVGDTILVFESDE